MKSDKKREASTIPEELQRAIVELRQRLQQGGKAPWNDMPTPLFPRDSFLLIGPGQRITLGTPMAARTELEGDGSIATYDVRNVPVFAIRPGDIVHIGYLEKTGEVPGYIRWDSAGLSAQFHVISVDNEILIVGTGLYDLKVGEYGNWARIKRVHHVDGAGTELRLHDTAVIINVPTLKSEFTTGGPYPEIATDWAITTNVAWIRNVVPLQFAKASVGTGQETIPFLATTAVAPVPIPVVGEDPTGKYLVYVHILSDTTTVTRTFQVMAGTSSLKSITVSNGKGQWGSGPEPSSQDYAPVRFEGDSISLVADAGDAMTNVSAIIGVS